MPLLHATAEGNLGLVDKLIGAGASGGAGWKGCEGTTQLHAAAIGGKEGVLDSLMKAGAQPDVNVLAPHPISTTPLFFAAVAGHEIVARRLITHGADINVKYPLCGTVLELAIKGGHEQLAEDLILHGADVRVRASCGCSLLHFAVREGLERVVTPLLQP